LSASVTVARGWRCGLWHSSTGWLRTGDIAERDADGCCRIVGRVKDMYVSGGENVHPAEVESVIAAFPGVAEVAVVGVPDDRWGEVGCAFVAGDGVDETALLAHCREHLAAFKVPATSGWCPRCPARPSARSSRTTCACSSRIETPECREAGVLLAGLCHGDIEAAGASGGLAFVAMANGRARVCGLGYVAMAKSRRWRTDVREITVRDHPASSLVSASMHRA
jgi:hypothetical protein